MKKILVALFICSALQIVYSQSGWVEVNPGFGHSYNSVHFIDVNTGVACGDNGAIIKSTNGGFNWINLNSGTSIKLNDIKMFSSNIIVAVGDYNLIMRSTNGGTSWYTVNQSTSLNYKIKNLEIHNSIQVTAYSQYFTDNHVLTSSNSGINWVFQQLSDRQYCVSFLDVNTGWSAGTEGSYTTVRKSIDGGLNWNPIYSYFGGFYVFTPHFIYFYDSLTAFMDLQANTDVVIYKSTNSGYNWNGVEDLGSYPVTSINFVNNQKGWLVCYYKIYATTNNGSNWINQVSPIANQLLMKVSFINENSGWIAATSAGILVTTSGGIFTGIEPLGNEISNSFSLSQNYPNPFNPVTKIKFDVPANVNREMSNVKLIIYDILGREVTTLVNEALKPGSYETEWPAPTGDGSNFASGIYFYSLQMEEFTQTKKMVLMK